MWCRRGKNSRCEFCPLFLSILISPLSIFINWNFFIIHSQVVIERKKGGVVNSFFLHLHLSLSFSSFFHLSVSSSSFFHLLFSLPHPHLSSHLVSVCIHIFRITSFGLNQPFVRQRKEREERERRSERRKRGREERALMLHTGFSLSLFFFLSFCLSIH